MSSDKLIHKLIVAVKSRPCIYDPTHDLHKNTVEINKSWIEIAAEVNENKQKITTLKRRWYRLRSCYAKYKKANDSTRKPANYNKYKHYRWGPQLHFLELNRLDKPPSDDSESNDMETELPSLSVNEHSEIPITQSDDISYLFLSYSKTFRKLTPKLKVALKLELANLFLKAEWEQIRNIDFTIPLKMETHYSDDD